MFLRAYFQEGYALYDEDNGNDEDGDNVADICDVLYTESAKCNKYMGDDGGYNVSTEQCSTMQCRRQQYTLYTPFIVQTIC